MLGYCAACERVLYLGFNAGGEVFFFDGDAPELAQIEACPDCAATLKSETVLSPADRDRREDRRMLEALGALGAGAAEGERGRGGERETAAAARPKAAKGRPGGCTAEVIARIVSTMRTERVSATAAARSAGVTTSNLSRWRKRFPEVDRKLSEARAGVQYSAQLIVQICDTMRRQGLSATAAAKLAGVPAPKLSRWRKEHPEITAWLNEASAEYERLHPRRRAGPRKGSAPAPQRDWLQRIMEKLA